jgi:histidinol-phosphatase
MFSTQLALMHRGEIIVGVSNAPVHNELAWAVRGEGAWLNDQKITVSEVSKLQEATVSTGNLGSMAAGPQWQKLGNIMSSANRTRGYGDYYHYHRLANGQVDAVIESDVNILDIAALYLIIREAGGEFTDLGGGKIDLNTRSVLAATPQLHPQLLQALA